MSSQLLGNLWNGPFESWDLAQAAAKNKEEIFKKSKWMERIAQQLTDYRDEYKKFGVAASPPRPSALPFICSTLSPKSIIDLGGASGWCWDYLLNSMYEDEVKFYTVVEVDEVKEFVFKNCFFKDRRIIYKTLKDDLNQCDLIYSNSVLQYFESNRPLIDLVKMTCPKHIFLEDVVAHQLNDDYFGLQFFYGKRIPYRFIGLQNLIDDMVNIGYRLKVVTPYHSPIGSKVSQFPMDNFPENLRIKNALSIYLERCVNI
jgi:putative methyltransferase (TIGR04325 family)